MLDDGSLFGLTLFVIRHFVSNMIPSKSFTGSFKENTIVFSPMEHRHERHPQLFVKAFFFP